ncbi:MAG: GTPase Era [Ignavibacteriae bacterium]|nr:GTPase Era [Ignavibacteriota bacterium]NOG99712.1 GTPase Era [Ignavibacteriota bacterium]
METKAGFVTIIGKPNVGKSTLMNALLGERLSIITNKPQTTRKRILGILSDEETQIIFLDTPGILDPSYLLQEKMVDYIINSAKDADVLLYLFDVNEKLPSFETEEQEELIKILKKKRIKKIAVLNKMDLSKQEDAELKIKELESLNLFDQIITISALVNFNVDALLQLIKKYLPAHPKYYPDDQLTDEPEKFFVSEIIREKIFEKYQDEIPYSTEVLIEEFKEREGRKDFIRAAIIVERDSQKPIIIGKRGDAIKRVGKIAREAIEEFLQRDVYLELQVKVKSKWRSNPQQLKNFGYTTGDEK